MASVGQRDTGPEITLRHALHGIGLRYRLNDRRLPGSPDLVFPKYHAVVFVHGCFWHAHPNCTLATIPRSRPDFWKAKLEDNRARDERCREALVASGWRVLVVWGCAVKRGRDRAPVDRLAHQVKEWLESGDASSEIGKDAVAEEAGGAHPQKAPPSTATRKRI